jgi:glycosyltransferase involved in cell wall biosynthesis
MNASHIATVQHTPVISRQASLHIVHAVPSITRTAGGTSTFVAELANHQVVDAHTAVTLLTMGETANDVPLSPRVSVAPALGRSATQWLRDWLRKARDAAAIDLLHAHALWLTHTHDALVAADSLGIPTVLSPHGMLEPHALRIKPWKKRLARFLYQDRDLRRAAFLHATAMAEAQNLRQFGLKQPIIVVPPGLELPPVAAMRSWGPQDRAEMLFFSRIHPIKNLLGLVDAWAATQPPEWVLRIVGPDEGAHAAAVQARIAALGVQNTVTLTGPVYGHAKSALFSTASVFILPSFTENFGIVVAEALSYGVPVIATVGTPWSDLVDRDCGWWVEPDHASLVKVLTEATRTPIERLRAMGLRGRVLSEEKYQWGSVCDAMRAAYLWALGLGPQPDCVMLAS